MWFRLGNAALGIWLMAASGVLGYGAPASTNDRIIGPLIASLAVIAIWETTRGLRRVNTVLGIWLLLAPWILGYSVLATVNSMVVGIGVVLLSFGRGTMEKAFGGGWSALLHPSDSKQTTQERSG